MDDLDLLRRGIRTSLNLNLDRAVLGDAAGKIYVTGRPGYVYVRKVQASGFSAAQQVRLHPNANIPMVHNIAVIMGQYLNELCVLSVDPAAITMQGLNPLAVNPLDPANQQSGQQDIVLFGSTPTNPASMNIITEALVYFQNWTVYRVGRRLVDLTSYKPVAGQHRVVGIFYAPGSGTAGVAGSTAQSELEPLDVADIQEAVDAALAVSPYARFTSFWRLTGSTTSVGSDNFFADGRQMINEPSAKAKLDAAAAPGAGDDAADGYTVGSLWLDISADAAYLCLDATLGAAVWKRMDNLGSGGGDSTSTAAYASRPAASNDGDLFFPSDGLTVERDTGSTYAPWGPIYPLVAPPTSSWSWVNQGSAAATAAKGVLHFDAPGVSGGTNVAAYVRAQPSKPYAITIALNIQFIAHSAAAGLGAAGLCWRESGSGKLVTHWLEINYSGLQQWYVYKWTDATTFSASYFGTNGATGFPLFLRIEDDNTNRKSSISLNGQNWKQLHGVGNTDFLSADQVGIVLRCNSGTSGHLSATLLSWAVT